MLKRENKTREKKTATVASTDLQISPREHQKHDNNNNTIKRLNES